MSKGYSALPLATDSDDTYPEREGRTSSRYTLFFVLSLSLLCNVILTFKWIIIVSQKPLSFPEAGYSPAQHMITYQTVKFHRGLQEDIPIYERPPSAEVDEAWRKLYAYAASRVPKSEVVKMTNNTWPILREEGNYVLALDVFHQLHCLDILRQQLYPGHNYTHQSTVHLRHCIGAIRQALMCYADVSPIVWQWSTKYKEAEQRDDILHTCRDFNKIQGWARERSMGSLPDLTVYLEG
ncbi:hypothetical protein C8R44DRAFT_984859 [Mycena epipterygia]|nr:hypothetical protein C8R44DRAFT_984859 [Mycena epipterygia]